MLYSEGCLWVRGGRQVVRSIQHGTVQGRMAKEIKDICHTNKRKEKNDYEISAGRRGNSSQKGADRRKGKAADWMGKSRDLEAEG